MRHLILALAVTLAGSALAEDVPGDPFDPLVLDSCLAAAKAPLELQACVRVGAWHCLGSAAGESNAGAALCTGAAAAQWDARLNAVYQARLAREEEADPAVAERLRAAQRSWIAFRDTMCGYEYDRFGGGSGAGSARNWCMMELTAAQALRLQEM